MTLSQLSFAQRLHALCRRSGLSWPELAAQLSSKPAACAADLSPDLQRRLAQLLLGRGEPPITPQDLASLASPGRTKQLEDVMGGSDQFWQSAEMRPGQALLKLNRVVTVDQFLRIMKILNEADAD